MDKYNYLNKKFIYIYFVLSFEIIKIIVLK